MKLLITGSTGYIGHQLALAAAKKGYEVQALLRDGQAPNRPVHPSITYVKGDITDADAVRSAACGCDAVLHAAGLAQLWNKNRKLFYKVNVDGTKNILQAAQYGGLKKIVFTSTGAVLGPSNGKPVSEADPRRTAFENDYEISKHCAEEVVRQYARNGLCSTIVALPRVYGPGVATGGNAVSNLIKKILKARVTFMPAAKDMMGNYAFIDDVVEGHFKALEQGGNGEKYILGGENVSYARFFQTVIAATGRSVRTIPVPKPVLQAAAAVVFGSCYLAGRHTNLSPKAVARLFQNHALNCEKAVHELGYTITPFDLGIAQTVAHLKNNDHD